MKVSIIGTGYVGLVHGAILTKIGHNVICVDKKRENIERLKKGNMTIFEPGLKEIILEAEKNGSIEFTTEIKKAIDNTDIIFLAIGTPEGEGGKADLKDLYTCVDEISKYITTKKIIVVKSTVPIGTCNDIEKILRKKIKDIEVLSNPEFLREGNAVNDSLFPERIVIGGKNIEAINSLKKLYLYFEEKGIPFVISNRTTSEMIKYASNAFLAVKISYINELANLAEKVGANISDVSLGMGLDKRIAPYFLECGPGYGGSCFPKDTKALFEIAKENSEELSIVKSAIESNKRQREKVVQKIENKLGGLKNKKIAILGLSFKENTDDTRDSPSIDIIKKIVNKGGKIQCYCPMGIEEAKVKLSFYKNIDYKKDLISCVEKVEALVILTPWSEFKNMDLNKIKEKMNGSYFFDFRNLYLENKNIRKLFKYYPLGNS